MFSLFLQECERGVKFNVDEEGGDGARQVSSKKIKSRAMISSSSDDSD